MRNGLLVDLVAIIALSACTAGEIRCDHQLLPINAPRAKLEPERAPVAHPPTVSQSALAPASDRREVAATPSKTAP
jgi:hypothetical protein